MEHNNFQTGRQEPGFIGSIHSGAGAAGGLVPAGLVPAGGFIGAAGGFLPAGYTLGDTFGGSAAGLCGGGAYAATSFAATTTGGGVDGFAGAADGIHAAGYSPSGSAPATGGVVAACSSGGGAAGPSSQKKRNRHTQQQVSALETFLKDYPRPRQVQINDLARNIGMNPTQVCCWIQNKRTQMKSQSKLEKIETLRYENIRLQTEIQHLTEVLSKNICPQCGLSDSQQAMDENHLRSENIRLREEMKHLQLADINYMASEDQQNLRVISPPCNIAGTQDKY